MDTEGKISAHKPPTARPRSVAERRTRRSLEGHPDRGDDPSATGDKRLSALVRIMSEIHQHLDLAGVIRAALDHTLEIVQLQAGMILLLDAKSGTLYVQDHRGVSEPIIRPFLDHPILPDDEIFGQAALFGAPRILAIDAGEIPVGAAELLKSAGWDRMAIWSLRARTGIIGALAVMGHRSMEVACDADFLDALGAAIGLAIANAQRYELLRSRTTALEQLIRELEEKGKEQEAFIHMASHGLKNPLVSIRGFVAELVRECYDALSEAGRFYTQRIDANAGIMERQIHGFLELSRVQRTSIAWEPVNVHELMREILDEIDYQIKHTNAEVHLIDLERAVVHGHRTLLKQVLMNLVDNALRYRNDEGRPLIRVGLEDTGRCWRFFVQDNGIGIAPEDRQRIFNVFEQISEARRHNPGGTGVGLAIVKQIVECHGGQVWVTSQPDRGSTFYCTLPKHASSSRFTARAVGM